MCKKIDINKPNWNSLTAWLDTSLDVNELAELDPIQAEFYRHRHRVVRKIKLDDGCDYGNKGMELYIKSTNGGRRLCTNCERKGCKLCLGTGYANFGKR